MSDAAIMGFIQGLTEFLPVSSSGHLALASMYLNFDIPPISYELVLHMATMLATIIFFSRDITVILVDWITGIFIADKRSSYGWTFGWTILVTTCVTAAVGFAIKDFAKCASRNPMAIAFGLLATGSLLLSGRVIYPGIALVRLGDSIPVGIAQGIAVLPGVSRSGMTIFTGQMMGLAKEEAFKFSFLLSIPVIIGATLLQAFDVGGWETFVATLPEGWLPGAAVAFVSGFLSLVLLKRLIIASKWWMFGVYCIVVGCITAAATIMEVL